MTNEPMKPRSYRNTDGAHGALLATAKAVWVRLSDIIRIGAKLYADKLLASHLAKKIKK